ncbi:MAG: ABC transporter permease [Acidobacteriota bacterium]
MRELLLGFRQWTRTPGLAVAAVLSIGLGVGATTAIFAVVRHVLLAPLPFPEPDRLVIVWETSPDNPSRWVAPANYLDWRRDTTHVFDGLAAFDPYSAAIGGSGEPERLRAMSASGTFFGVLGQGPSEGRLLIADDDRPGAPCVAVLAGGLRARRFGRGPAVGEPLVVDGRACEIVGVLPASFSFALFPAVELWTSGDRGVPRTFPFPGDVTTVRDAHLLFVLGRLRPHVTPGTAAHELGAVMARLATAYPDTNTGLGAHVESLHAAVVGNVRSVLLLLQATVALLMFVACANVAHLLLGQMAARRQELAVRAALGARRHDLVRQLLAEAAVLAGPGAVLGLLLATWSLDVLVSLAPASVPRLNEIGVDPWVLSFGVALTALTTVIFALAPALEASSPAVSSLLAHGRRVAGRDHGSWHRAIVIAELALAQVLVVGAVLLTASLLAALRVPLGFVPGGRVTAELTLLRDPYLRPTAADGFAIDPAPRRQLVDAVVTRLSGTAGVRAVAASFTPPLGGAPNRGVHIEGAPEPAPGQEPTADFQAVTPDYFRATGTTVMKGRAFTAADDERGPPVAVVNLAFADRYLAGRDALGGVVRIGKSRRHVVVGVVADARNRQIERAAEPAIYVPLPQNDEGWPFLAVTAWVDGDAAAAGPLLRAALSAADPHQPISNLRTVDALLAAQLAPRRFITRLVSLFGALSVVLAAIGAYGVMALSVATRRREIGLRSALGATAGSLRRMVLREASLLALLAAALGLGLAIGAGRLAQSLLYQVSATDPIRLVCAAAFVVMVGVVAAFVPAQRAARLAPLDALRGE